MKYSDEQRLEKIYENAKKLTQYGVIEVITEPDLDDT